VASGTAATAGSLGAVIARMQRAVSHGRDHADDAYATLRTLCDDLSAELDRELLVFLGTGAHRHEADLLHELHAASDDLHQQLTAMRRELETLMPWLALAEEPAARAIALPTNLRLDELGARGGCGRSSKSMARDRRARDELSEDPEGSVRRLAEALHDGELRAAALVDELFALAALAGQEVRGMDFRLLFDRERKLFHIGYNATLDRIDPHYYDLLASEARLAS
jgi:cyclic beta-1,2-glucan synthetase